MMSLRIIVMFLYMVLAVGCSHSPVVSRVMVEEPTRLVRLDLIDHVGSSEFSHPLSLTKEKIEALLDGVTFGPRSFVGTIFSVQQSKQKAFSGQQRKFLALHFSQAFRQATSLEKVVFYLNQERDQQIREITSGGAYIQGDIFHLIIANYRFTVSGTVQAQRSVDNPLLVLGEVAYNLEGGPNGERIDAPSLVGQTFMSRPQHFAFSLKSLESHDSETEPSFPGQSDGNPSDHHSVIEKMKLLERLKEERLITEDEYQQKRKDLLDAL